MDPTQFEQLLQRLEDSTTDFKREHYDFGGAKDEAKVKRAKFVNDVLAMWNTPRDDPSYIILGVECQPSGTKVLHGLNGHVDDAILRQQLDGWIFPVPNFSYHPVQYQGREFAVLTFPPDRTTGPCLPLLDVGEKLLRMH